MKHKEPITIQSAPFCSPKSTSRMYRIAVLAVALIVSNTLFAGWTAQINTPMPTVPFGSNTDYEFGNLPTNLPSGGTYGGSQFVHDEYVAWVDEWVSDCGNGTARVIWDGGGTVSEGIAYGMILAAYAGDKDQFDALWAYYDAFKDSKGLMDWHTSGCSGVSGTGGATDAEMDAAMGLIIAEYQWPNLNSPYDYEAEAIELITAIKDWEVQPTGYPGPYQVNPGGNWGFNNSCRNPGYIATGYIKAWGDFIPSQQDFWHNQVIPANYALINSNAHATTGLASDWCQADGTPGGCGDGGSFGDDASRFPWRIGVDAYWYGDSDAGTIAQNIADYTSSNGRTAYNSGGFIPLSGGAGTVSPTFTSMFAVSAVARGSQSHINDYYDALAAMNTSFDQGYFPEILRQIGLFVLSGNFWKPGAESGGCSTPDLGADASLCGVSELTLNSGLSTDGVKTFQWYRNDVSQGAASTSANTRSINQGGTWKVVVDSLGECSSQDEIIIATTLPSVDLGSDIELCDPSTATLDAGVVGAGITYEWRRNGSVITDETGATLEVTQSGTYQLTISAASCGSESDEIVVTSLVPVSTGDTICTAGMATLSVVDEGGSYEWFINESDNSPVFTGATYTPNITSTTTFYVKDASSFSGSVGPAVNHTNQYRGADDTYGLNFTVTETLTIDSVSIPVRAWNNSDVTFVVRILDSNGSELQTTGGYTWSSPGGSQDVEARIPVGLTVDPGDYRIDLDGTNMNGNNLEWQNSGASYPYNSSPSGLVSITGSYENANNMPNAYGFIYDWLVSSGSNCAKAPVTAVLDPGNSSCASSAPTADFSANVVQVCIGENVTFTDASTDDPTSWSWDFGAGASLAGGTTGQGPHTVSYATSGMKTVQLTASNNAGSDQESKTAYIEVLASPTPSVSIAGSSDICEGDNVTFTATPTNGGIPSYQWRLNNSDVGTNSNTYANTGLVDGDVVSLIMTSTAQCAAPTNATSNEITMTVDPAVTPSITIVGDNVTCGGVSVDFSTTANGGGNSPGYQWQVNDVDVGSDQDSYSAVFNEGDEVKVILTSNANCATQSTATSSTMTMVVGPPVTPSVSIAGPTDICSGASADFSATPTGGGSAPSYQWQVNGADAGTDSDTFSSTSLNDGDEVTVILTSNESCASPLTATSNGITVNVISDLAPSVTIAGDENICDGESASFTATPVNGGSTPAYQWQVNGGNVGSNSPTFSSSSLNDGDEVTVILTSSETCANPTTATSNSITIAVTSEVTPSVTITGDDQICEGENASFTANAVNGGANPSFQWQINGANFGSDAASFTASGLTDGQIVTVILTSDLTCATTPTATSNEITVGVDANVTPTVSISGNTSLCEGDNQLFQANGTNGGTNPGYQWLLEGNPVGSNPTYDGSGFSDGDVLQVIMTSSETCVTSPAAADQVTLNITAATTPSVMIDGSTSICEGDEVTFTATPTDGGTPAYQWAVDNNPVGTDASTYTASDLTDGQVVTVVMQSTLSCVTDEYVTSNSLTMEVQVPVTPTVTVTGDPVSCAGELVDFTSSATDGGNNPVYDWQVNGASTGIATMDFSSATLNDGDEVTVVMTSNANCIATSTVTSNAIVMQIGPPFTPTVSIDGPSEICENEEVLFTATPIGGGNTPAYQWKLDGFNVGTDSDTYESTGLPNGAIITVELTSSSGCANPATASSNEIIVQVNPGVTPTVAIDGPTSICDGESAAFNAVVTGQGSTPVYDWMINGISSGSGSGFSADNLVDTDEITVALSSSEQCATSGVVTSSALTITVNPSVTPSVSIDEVGAVCEGEAVQLTANTINEGPGGTFDWMINAASSGQTGSSFTANDLNDGDVISVQLTSDANCAVPATVISNQVVVNINAPQDPTATISGDALICGGEEVTFSSSVILGGNTVYQWMVNGGNVGTGLATYTSSSFVDGDQVSLQITSDANCISSNTATSNTVVMEVGPPLTPTVDIVGNADVCQGQSLDLSTNVQGGGDTPSFDWRVNGSSTGQTDATFSSASLNNGDQVTVELTSSAFCAIPSVVTSGAIDIVVISPVTPGVGIAGETTLCEGIEATFDAQVVNGGNAPLYTWTVNGAPVGSGAQFSSSTIPDGATVGVEVTSDETCVTSTTATSEVSVVVEENVNPTVVVNGDVTACQGEEITLTASASDAGNNPNYQWFSDGNATGTGVTALNITDPVDGQEIYVEVSATGCAGTVVVTSSTLVLNVAPPSVATAEIQAESTDLCQGSIATFDAVTENEGNDPNYHWSVNGVQMGINNASFSTSSLVDGDEIGLMVTSSQACVSPQQVVAETITVSVTSTVSPAVIINGDNTICQGESTSFLALAVNAGANPTYQWTVNNLNTGVTTAEYTSTTLSDKDVIRVDMVADVQCSNDPLVSSNSINMSVQQSTVPSIDITSGANTICIGDAVSFDATVANAGSNPVVQWFINDANSGEQGLTFTADDPDNGDVVTAVVHSTATCASPQQLTSNAIAITVDLCIGISETGIDALNLYPNPARTMVQVTGVVPGEQVLIYDLLGQEKLLTQSTTNQLTIDVSLWAKGVYIVKTNVGSETQILKMEVR